LSPFAGARPRLWDLKREMPKSSNRNFRLSDAMAFIVATALALAATRPYWTDSDNFEAFQPGGKAYLIKFVNFMNWARSFLYSASYFTACWSLTCLVLGLRRPRRSFRSVFRQPGMVACLVAAVVLGIRMVNIAVEFSINYTWFGGGDFLSYLNAIELLFDIPSEIGCAIAAAWLVQKVSGRWRPEPCWIDRLGRALGLLWMTTIPFSCFSWQG
jgi:hypothetical protein